MKYREHNEFRGLSDVSIAKDRTARSNLLRFVLIYCDNELDEDETEASRRITQESP